MDFTTLAALRKYLSVNESQPGRIQIKFSLGIMKDAEALKLAQSPPAMPKAVTNVSINAFSRTLSLEYDADQIRPTLLEELVTTDDDARAAAIVEDLHQALYA